MSQAQYSQINSFGEMYFLFSKIAKLRGWKEHRIFFFAHSPNADVGTGQPEPFVPAGKRVAETKDGKLYIVSDEPDSREIAVA